MMRFIPLAFFVGLAALFGGAMFWGEGDPSAFEGRPAPVIPAVALANYPTFDESVFADGEVKIVNFWASNCPPCYAEHPYLLQLAEEGVAIYGVNWKDEPGAAVEFLETLGNPFRAVTVDATGRNGLEWGLAAIPETFVLDGDGTVLLRFKGPINGVMDTIIRPALAEAAG